MLSSEVFGELGWKFADQEAEYTLLVGSLGPVKALCALVRCEDSTVVVALPYQCREHMGVSEADEYPPHRVKARKVRTPTESSSTALQVIFMELETEALTDFPEADLGHLPEDVLTFSPKPSTPGVVPFYKDLITASVKERLGSGTVPDAGMDLVGLVKSLSQDFKDSFATVNQRLSVLERGPVQASPTPFVNLGPEPGMDRGAAEYRARELLEAGPPGLKAVPKAMPAPVGAEMTQTLGAMTQLLQKLATPKHSSGYEAGLSGAGSVEDLDHLTLGADGLGKLGAAQIERLRLTRESQPSLVVQAHERDVQRDLGILPGEGWSHMRHARERVLPHAAGYHGLRKFTVILAQALDLHRVQGPEHSRAFLCQAYKCAQAASVHPQKQWGYAWPLLGIEDPDGVARPTMMPSETAALAAYHRDQEQVQKLLHGTGAGRDTGEKSTPGATASGGEDARALRQELDKLKKQLAEEKKRGGSSPSKGKKGDKGEGRNSAPQ
eukprot:6491567-Amphidinium_carterae.1